MMKIKTGVSTLMMILACVVLASMLGCSSSSSDGDDGLHNARLEGNFATASFECTLDASGNADSYEVKGGDMTSNGNGTGDMGSDNFTYTMAADNTFDITTSGNTDKGILSPSGNFLTVVDTDETDSEISLAVAVKKPSDTVALADLNGDWLLCQVRYNSDDARVHTSWLNYSFSDGTATGSSGLDSDDGVITPPKIDYTVNSDGKMKIDASQLEGYTDGEKFVLVDYNPNPDDNGEKEVKIIIGIKKATGGLDNASLKGNYQVMRIDSDVADDDSCTVHLNVNFQGNDDGSGTGNWTGTVIKCSDGDPASGKDLSGIYHVTDTGTMTIDADAGIMSSDGEIFVTCDASTSSSDDVVAFTVGIKKND